jgi:hypothetical protein
MAFLSGIIIVMVVIFYFWGKKIRHKTWDWWVMQKYGRWDEDREVGE